MKIIYNLKSKARRLKEVIFTVYIALNDKRTPWFAKLMIVITISYAISPIDLIPDFIPILGYVDDLIILPVFITIAIKLIPPEVLIECRKKVKDNFSINKKFGILAATFIILIWIAIIVFIILKITKGHFGDK